MNRKMKTRMQTTNNRTILRCRMIFRAKCIRKKSSKKGIAISKENRKKMIKKWEKLMINRKRRI